MPQYNYTCPKCGWAGPRITRFESGGPTCEATILVDADGTPVQVTTDEALKTLTAANWGRRVKLGTTECTVALCGASLQRSDEIEEIGYTPYGWRP